MKRRSFLKAAGGAVGAVALHAQDVLGREEEKVALNVPHEEPLLPDSPHEGCPGAWA